MAMTLKERRISKILDTVASLMFRVCVASASWPESTLHSRVHHLQAASSPIFSGPIVLCLFLPSNRMYNQFRGGPARLNSYHGPKRQLLGNPAGHVPPAWRNANVPAGLPHNANIASGSGPKKAVEAGSKILLSNLPMDVGENEVEVSASASEHIRCTTC